MEIKKLDYICQFTLSNCIFLSKKFKNISADFILQKFTHDIRFKPRRSIPFFISTSNISPQKICNFLHVRFKIYCNKLNKKFIFNIYLGMATYFICKFFWNSCWKLWFWLSRAVFKYMQRTKTLTNTFTISFLCTSYSSCKSKIQSGNYLLFNFKFNHLVNASCFCRMKDYLSYIELLMYQLKFWTKQFVILDTTEIFK